MSRALVREQRAVTAVHGKIKIYLGKIKFYLFLLRASRVTRESARRESARSFRPLNRPSPTCPYPGEIFLRGFPSVNEFTGGGKNFSFN